MVEIRKAADSELDQIKTLSVADDQVKFVGVLADLLQEVPNTWHLHVITADKKIVGFFNIDVGYSSNYSFAGSDELGLRTFFIDSGHQGKGYGKAAVLALEPYLTITYSGWASAVLTVNCKNKSAYNCYVNGGFKDTGDLFHGGNAGPQHIMRLSLAGHSVIA
ncbi:GNAT family N-acetyltransferase [Reinekea marinisedimentorum]|uniref:Acetyltransferase (GNAT) family protein n=1 Tax=Reinekea marinisedimentorum TaxID=230495 RepID=A0A4V2UJU2_9GAMM|nr:GNAT family N-acetyltransferase [Reinekea marinisedimentorum]TCS41271.1 acetyltransferase (GNAT) family protein [Reinekea marinisedimentorum]